MLEEVEDEDEDELEDEPPAPPGTIQQGMWFEGMKSLKCVCVCVCVVHQFFVGFHPPFKALVKLIEHGAQALHPQPLQALAATPEMD